MNLNYIIRERTNGANPFKIFSALENLDKEALAFAIRRMPYHVFLTTAYWFGVSSVAKSRAGMRCQVCNCDFKLQVHHRTYDTHGCERLNMVDLIVLCDHCYGLFHGHQPVEYKRPRLENKAQRKKLPKGFTIPHTEADLSMPEGDPIILTKALVDKCRANGSFTNATLRAFGLTKSDMSAGWPARLEGVSVPRANYLAALEGRFIYKTGALAA